jgi:hypothetical protein
MANRLSIVVAATVAAAACSHQQKAPPKLDDSGLARLDEQQMQPVDEARVEEGRARDAVARSKANEADARARLDVANTERGVADAQMKRAQAERELLKKQYANKDQMARADEEVRASQQRIQAADLKRAYLEKMVQVAQSDSQLAQAHLDTSQALTEQVKQRAMKAADAPQAQSVNAGELDSRVAQAQLREAQLRKQAADQRASAVDLYNRWQETDARVRMLARPEPLPVPPPTGEATR